MRERRWETPAKLTFDQILAVEERLAARGLAPTDPAKDVICYVEEWTVEKPDDFDQLDPWATEDVTLVHSRDVWQGDFFLLAGGYHTVYRRFQAVGTYCSVSHPWRIAAPLVLHDPQSMLWLGFRHSHGFVRVRLQTQEVITPGERRGDAQRARWIEERRRAFSLSIGHLNLPVEIDEDKEQVVLRCTERSVPFFCSWPDAFGPCQYEFNTSDPYEFLVPASRLVSTWGSGPARVRAYLTGFSEEALEAFAGVEPGARVGYRCSVHCALDEVPEVLQAVAPAGRLYTTLCEFQTSALLPDDEDGSAIVGLVGANGVFQLEVRLNRAPLPEEKMAGWLDELLGYPVVYAPLPPFP
jgi:hypothetical protein